MKFEKKKTKNRISAVLMCLLLFTALLSPAFTGRETAKAAGTPIVDGGPEIKSAAAVVMDINSGTVLYSKAPETAIQPSSLTKLMTAYVAFSELSGSITISSGATSQTFPTAQNAGFVVGDTTTVGDAITGMLMASAEDCAYALSEKGGGMDSFAMKMNEYAESLGLVNTHYVNCMGLHAEGHYSCAIDCAVVAARLMKDFPATSGILSMKETTLEAESGAKMIKNAHRFIAGTDSYDKCYAAKTGGSAYKGDGSWASCTYAASNGLNLVCIVMGCPENAATYADTKLLLDYAFANFMSIKLTESRSEERGLSGLFDKCPEFGTLDYVDIRMDGNASCIVPKDYDESLLRSDISFVQPEHFSPGKNVIGSMKIYYDDRVAGSTDVVYYMGTTTVSDLDFARIFPSYLKLPKNGSASPTGYDKLQKAPSKRESTLSKAMAVVYKFFTKAKMAAYIFTIVIFAIGTALLIIFFPTKKKVSTDGLYKKRPQETKLYDKE